MSEKSERTCSAKGFRALLVTQFFGALNDNLFKLFITLLVVNIVVKEGSGISHLILINVFFVVPYILFSALAGGLADRYSKSRLIRFFKVLEVGIMCVAMYLLTQGATYALLVVLFGMGLQSTLFSPSKYGILPEILDDSELSKGNGFLEFCTFIGIIAGTALAGLILSVFPFESSIPGLILVLFALVGLGVSFFVTRSEPANPQAQLNWNPFSVMNSIKEIRQQHGLFLTVVAIAYFWSIGSLYQLNLVLYAKTAAGLDDLGVSLLLAALGVGIGCGSIVAGRVSEGQVELGLVPLGAIGLSATSILLAFTAHMPLVSGVLLLGLGFSAGFYIVPLNAFLQENSPSDRRGNFIAASNFVSFVGMLSFSYFLLLLIDHIGLTPPQVFLVCGLSAIAIAVYICTVLPEVLLRCINWILIHAVYRMEVFGKEHIPKEGGALLVCNHVSMADASILLASLGRPVRFMMYRPFYESKFVHPFAKAMGAIPVEGGGKRTETDNALAGATQAIQDGELVGIFAEGAITRTGQLLKFKRGLERIMADADAPIIPVHLDQVWGSVFSFKHGRFFWKIPKLIPYPVTVSFGTPLPATAKSHEVRQAVQELSTEAFSRRPRTAKSLPAGFIRSAKSGGFRNCMSDSSGAKLSWYSTLASALSLSSIFRSRLSADEQFIGVALPASVPAALSNVGLSMSGKTPVNLNWTASEASVSSAIEQCQLASIITCAAIKDKIPQVPANCQLLLLEDLLAETTPLRKVLSYAQAILLPGKVIERLWVTAEVEALATVLFSSGSTGTPKGVMLTHQNISSNCTAMHELFPLNYNDGIAGVLPFFHSFGFTGTLWFPLLAGCRVVYHGNPLAAAKVGELVQKHKLAGLMTTPTFLGRYTKKCTVEQFRSLRFVMVGAEKLSEIARAEFVEKFGVEPR